MNSQVTKLTFVGFFFLAQNARNVRRFYVCVGHLPGVFDVSFFFFLTLALIHSPPVSYTMPFPHQAMVRVADIGV